MVDKYKAIIVPYICIYIYIYIYIFMCVYLNYEKVIYLYYDIVEI